MVLLVLIYMVQPSFAMFEVGGAAHTCNSSTVAPIESGFEFVVSLFIMTA